MAELRRWTLSIDMTAGGFEFIVGDGPDLVDDEQVEVMPVTEHEAFKKALMTALDGALDHRDMLRRVYALAVEG